MKILLIIPGINKKYNDNAHSFIAMKNQGADVVIITNRLRITKGPSIEPPYEVMDGIPVHRIYKNFTEQSFFPFRKFHRVYRIAEKLRPDIIFCAQQRNMVLAAKLKRIFKVPVLLSVEFALNANRPFLLLGAGEGKVPRIVGKLLADIYWRWLRSYSSTIITCYHDDKANFNRLSNNITGIHYVPWPTHLNSNFKGIQKIRGRGIFIGALTRHKNISEFNFTLPRIFNETPTKEFYIIGSGEYKNRISSLMKKYPDKIKYIPSIERDKALELIASSYYAYAPMKWGGWGFIGDCWAVKTPIIATNNDYELVNNDDSLITSPENIVDIINKLYGDDQLYGKIQNGGFERYDKYHTAEAVGKEYFNIAKTLV